MDKATFIKSGLLEQYVLGLSTQEEARLVEQFVARHPDIRQELEALQEAMEAYASQYVASPPPELRDQVIDLAKTSPPGGAGILMRWFVPVLALLFGIAALLLFIDRENLINSHKELYDIHVEMERDCLEQRKQCNQVQAHQAFLQHKHTHSVPLRGTNLAPESMVVVFWNPLQKKAVLLVDHLPDAPQGHTYQLWADVDGQMINAGVFDCDTKTMQTVMYIDRAESLNITLEPLGGSKHPNVDLLTANGPV